ncbi:MAG: type II toxin-antitoxin system VapC family toxin [Holosporaceae bacterium]|jgi:PIN domain nuclease of toxin-antitoxin system|nr:type II toxin-antitoxin system VapC family toxin [Rhodospirillaceae bacterium]
MVKLLLDTHVLLWCLSSSDRLPASLREKIVDAHNDVWVSAATVWEIGIKKALGKLQVPDDLLEAITFSGFNPLPITLEHAELAAKLPKHHDDPFDRVLVAQAMSEELILVSHDARLPSYNIPVLTC